MSKSIQKRQKQLRKQAKPHTPYSQAQRYWPREIRNRDRLKDDRQAYYADELPTETIEAIKNVKMDSRHDHLNELLD